MIRVLLSTRLGERRWTQADLARMTGIRPSTINDLFHNIAERMNFEHLDLICEALGCEITDVIVRVPRGEVQLKSRTGTELHTQK
jgi:putative transcriptional regulator